jgi:tetratricopeptide (TPR) repeat protein
MDTFNEKLGGLIKYYGLTDWWLATFTADERHKIVETYQPMGFTFEWLVEEASDELVEEASDELVEGASDELTEGEVQFSSGSATDLLSGLAGWFKNESDRRIAYRLLGKAEELLEKADVLEKHFMYQAKIQIYYRFRDVDDFALQKAVEACEQQIFISDGAAKTLKEEYGGQVLPAHVGFEQLAIIREKEGRIEEAIKLCEQALKEGWSGNWERRITRYEKRRPKLS